jgi:WD40 repeat protein
LVGDTDGNVQVHLNSNSNDDPVLAAAYYIKAAGVRLDAGERATPVVDDWNSDGKKDLLTGGMDGKIKVYINTGTDTSPAFESFYFLQSAGSDFKTDSRSAPRVYDWNKDGLKDLLVGEMDGHVFYLKNVGTNKTPAFDKYNKLFLINGDILRYQDTSGYPRSRLFVTDWNSDNLDDMLVGGADGRIMLFLSASEPSSSPLVLLNRIWTQSGETTRKFLTYSKKEIKRILGRT